MALQYNVQDFPLNGKLDMHSDDMDVQAPNLIRMENVIVSAPGRYDRRPGIRSFDGQTYRNKGIQSYYPTDAGFNTGTTVSDSAPGMFSLGATPVSLHKHRVLTHDVNNTSSVQTFHGNHFPYPLEIGPAQASVSSELTALEISVGIVRTGDYICRGYYPFGSVYVYLDVWDANTGQQLVRKFPCCSDLASGARVCLAPSDSGLAIAYSTTTANTVKILFFTTSTFSTGTPTIATTVTVSNVQDNPTGGSPTHMWDFVGSYSAINASNYFAFAYLHTSTGWINVNSYSQTGAAGPSFDVNVAGKVVGNLRCTQNISGYYVAYDLAAGGTGLCGFPTALTSSLFNVTILAAFTATFIPYEYALAHLDSENGNTAKLCVWITGKNAFGNYETQSSFFNITTGAEVSTSSRYTSYGHNIASRGFVIDGKPCVCFGKTPVYDPTVAAGNVYNVTNILVLMYDYCILTTTTTSSNPYAPLVIAKFGNDDVDSSSGSSGVVVEQHDVYVRNKTEGSSIGNTDGTGGEVHFSYTNREAESGTALYINNHKHFFINLSHRSPVAFQGAELAGYLYLSGACPSIFDGKSVFECGYNEAPNFSGYAEAATGSSTLTAGSYLVTMCWEWQDSQSRVHRSQPATPVTVTITGALKKIHLGIPRLECTQKEINGSEVLAAIYIANPADPFTYYFHSSVANVQGAVSQAVDITSPSPTSNRVLYITGGALENDMWPSIGAMCSYQNRIFVVDTEKDQILYSKSFTDEEAPEISLFNALEINDLGGSVKNIKSKDQLLIAWKRSATYITSGQPANDLGQGVNFSEWQPVSQSVGCRWPRATTQTTDGIWFVSDNGPQLFSQGQIANVGEPISPFAGYDFIAASNIETSNRSHVVFSVYSGTVAQTIASTGTARLLVYDRTHQTWAIWKNDVCSYISGICAPSGTDKLYYGIYIYNNYPSIATESNTLYTDTRFDGAAATWYAYVRTGWLNFGSQQSLTRVRRIVCLLDSMLSAAGSLHQTTLNLYRDFNDTLVESSTFTAQYNQGYTLGVPIQFRTRTAKQKMQSLSIEVRIGMDSSATATMGAKLSGMTIETAQRGGAVRLPATKTANV